MHTQTRFGGRRTLLALSLCGLSFLPAANAVVGDAAAGKAQVAACGACHGQDGASPIDPSYPVLAGQNAKYLERQLAMIQSDQRPIPLMAGQLNGK